VILRARERPGIDGYLPAASVPKKEILGSLLGSRGRFTSMSRATRVARGDRFKGEFAGIPRRCLAARIVSTRGGESMIGLARNCLFVTLICLSAGVLAQDQTQESGKTEVIPSKDESVIRGNVVAFVKAFNAGNAKAIGELFVPEAQMVDEEGNTTQGREAIEKVFTGILAEKPQPQMAVEIESIRSSVRPWRLSRASPK
jgi:hypothetical protein